MPLDETSIATFLDDHAIAYERFDHEAVFTCEASDRVIPAHVGGVQTKNLFLRDKRGRRHWLLVTLCAKAVDLRALGEQWDERLSFGSAERLSRYLGVTPGSVTILALANDPTHDVELVVDSEVWRAEFVRAHPLINTATLVLAHVELEKFLQLTGHTVRVADVPERDVTD